MTEDTFKLAIYNLTYRFVFSTLEIQEHFVLTETLMLNTPNVVHQYYLIYQNKSDSSAIETGYAGSWTDLTLAILPGMNEWNQMLKQVLITF